MLIKIVKPFLLTALLAVCLLLALPAGQARAMDSSEVTLRKTMRKLWTDHVVWTREYIRSSVDGQGDAKFAASRLMQNQDEIGAAVAGYYGADAGRELTRLLKEHIGIAVKIVDAAKAKDSKTFDAQNKLWQQNGDEIAGFLSSANPNWPEAAVKSMMQKHLSTTAAELTARLNKDYAGDVAAFDAVYDHILMMADALSDGIIAQFPEKFEGMLPAGMGNNMINMKAVESDYSERMNTYQTNHDAEYRNTNAGGHDDDDDQNNDDDGDDNDDDDDCSQ